MGVNCKMDPYFPQQMHVLARMILYLCSSMFRISFPDRDGVFFTQLFLFLIQTQPSRIVLPGKEEWQMIRYRRTEVP